MAKTGFSYYNIDTDRYLDIRIKRLKKDFGCNGIAVYDYLLNEIYRVKGCFLVWDESTAFDVSDYFGLKESTVIEIVNYCCNVGLFSKELRASGGVLTSQSIQRRFVEMSTRAKRKEASIPENISLLTEEITKVPEKIPEVTEVFDKVKKSKVNNNPPLSPPTREGGEGNIFELKNLKPPNDGIQREFEKFKAFLSTLSATSEEKEQIAKLSNYGAIGDNGRRFWTHEHELYEDSIKSGIIKHPAAWLIYKLRNHHPK